MTVTSNDIALVHQDYQKRLIMIKVYSRGEACIGLITGNIVSANFSIDSSSAVRRTGTLDMLVENDTETVKTVLNLTIYNSLRVYIGIVNNATSRTSWYLQGTYIMSSAGFSYDATSRRLSLSLVDRMYDFTGERRGRITGALDPIVEYKNKISDVIKDMVTIYGGVTRYNICAICQVGDEFTSIFDKSQEESEKDYQVPYDITFPTGVTIYEVCDKMVTLYPYYEMFFDADGTFIVQRSTYDDESTAIVLNSEDLLGLVVSEERNLNIENVKNVVEVWGKDGLYYGKAQDEYADSPFNVLAVGQIPAEPYQYDDVYTTYYDNERTKVREKGDKLAQDWAEYLLWHHCRLYDSITITLINCPFINDVNFKLSYRSRIDGREYTYLVTNVESDYTSNTTTLNCVRVYNKSGAILREQLATPTVEWSVDGYSVSAQITPVENAETYTVYADGVRLVSGSSEILTYTFLETMGGEYTFTVKAQADSYTDSLPSTEFTAIIGATEENPDTEGDGTVEDGEVQV